MGKSWRARAFELAQRAQGLLGAGDAEAAMRDVSSGFALVEAEGRETDLAHVALLIVAADIATSLGEIESGAALFRRSFDICTDLARTPAQGRNDVPQFLARALLGLARADVARGWNERARERYAAALELMEAISESPQELIAEARLGSQGRFGD